VTIIILIYYDGHLKGIKGDIFLCLGTGKALRSDQIQFFFRILWRREWEVDDESNHFIFVRTSFSEKEENLKKQGREGEEMDENEDEDEEMDQWKRRCDMIRKTWPDDLSVSGRQNKLSFWKRTTYSCILKAIFEIKPNQIKSNFTKWNELKMNEEWRTKV